MGYVARGVHQLPRHVAGPLQEWTIGSYDNADDAYHCVRLWRILRAGQLARWRGAAYVEKGRP